MPNIKYLATGYIATITALFLYSFTQVDLGLALTRYPELFQIQRAFQNIGYFNRPLSTYIFLAIISLLFLFYIIFIRLASKNKIERKTIWKIIILTTVILAFSYNAFSYDLFNYIFDSRIVTHYHSNPYIHKALDYPGDPMLSFMRWTHRTYPYGPGWLLATVPLSFLGGGVFILIFFLFKILAAASFLALVFAVGKILKKIRPKDEVFGITLLALNPLVIVESLVSAHIDITMMSFGVLSLYFLIQKKYLLSIVLLIFSGGIKFVTFLLLPIFAASLMFNRKISKETNWNMIFYASLALMIVGIVLQSLRTNFQPWYVLGAMSFAALVPKKYYVVIPAVFISFFSLLAYVPFLYTGNWDPPIPQILTLLNITGISVSLIAILSWRILHLDRQ